MRTFGTIVMTAVVFAVASSAMAQVKGTGKTSLTIIRWDEVGNAPVGTKAAGSHAGKPKASVLGFPPSGGASTALKLPFQAGPVIDPLKPGFPAGDYILDIETSDTAIGDSNTVAFVKVTMSALGKCTAHAAPPVDGDSPTDWCNTIGTACSPTQVDKCTFTTYQVSGSLSPLAPGNNQPSASRIRLRKRVADCETGDLMVGPTAVRPNDLGAPAPYAHDCRSGDVVGVMGLANGEVDPAP